MKGRMKVAMMEDIGRMVVKEMDIPSPGPGEVLVRWHQCNICTLDWQTWAGLRKSMKRHFPWANGHEMAGEIVEIGEGVRSDLKVGMHVGAGSQPSRGCGECYACRYGHPDRCTNKPGDYVVGDIRGSFGMAQYYVYESSRIYKIDDNLPYEEACFLEPVSTCVHGAKRLRVTPGDKVLVIGAGNLGLVNAQVARAFGGKVLVSEVDQKRCALAESLGFKTINPAEENVKEKTDEFTDGRGIDAVILAVANTKANDQALEVIAPRGRILFFASGHPIADLNIDANQIHYKEYELIGTYNSDPSDFQTASALLGSGAVKVDKIISGKIMMDDVQHAFELAATPGTYRVSLTLD